MDRLNALCNQLFFSINSSLMDQKKIFKKTTEIRISTRNKPSVSSFGTPTLKFFRNLQKTQVNKRKNEDQMSKKNQETSIAKSCYKGWIS